jgi:hypothetical protein
MASCHLSGRFPHEAIRDLLDRAPFLHPEEVVKRIEHVAGVIGALVLDFAHTVKLPEPGSVVPPRASAGDEEADDNSTPLLTNEKLECEAVAPEAVASVSE